MASQRPEAVIAGSRGFAAALLAPMTERVGIRPRIAADPAQAVALTAGGGLVVVEFQGDRSLDGIRELLRASSDVSVIAAVPAAHAGVEDDLRSLGVVATRWNGNPAEVLSAVANRLAAQPVVAAGDVPAAAHGTAPVAQGAAPAAAANEGTGAAARGPGSPGVGALFDGLALDGSAAPDAAPSPPPVSAAAAAGPVASGVDAPPAPAPGPDVAGAWPSSMPSEEDAAAALEEALRGVGALPGSAAAVIAGVLGGMSPLEQAVLRGEPQPIDAGPVRRAALMRSRVAVAVAFAPRAPGAPTDAAAFSARLAELDAVLAEVKTVAAAAPPELLPQLEQVRNALVREALEFSEALHRAAPAADAVAPAPPAGLTSAAELKAAQAARKAAQARVVVTSKAERELEARERRRVRVVAALLGLSIVAALGYHGSRYLQRRAFAQARPTVVGAPARATVVAPQAPPDFLAPPVTVLAQDGKGFTTEELKRLADEQSALGNVVREVSPGVVVITPGRAGRPPGR